MFVANSENFAQELSDKILRMNIYLGKKNVFLKMMKKQIQ